MSTKELTLKAKRRDNFDQRYKFSKAFKSNIGILNEKLETEPVALTPEKGKELTKFFAGKREGSFMKLAWYVVDAEDSDLAVSIYTDVSSSRGDDDLWFWTQATDEAFQDKVLKFLRARDVVDRTVPGGAK